MLFLLYWKYISIYLKECYIKIILKELFNINIVIIWLIWFLFYMLIYY